MSRPGERTGGQVGVSREKESVLGGGGSLWTFFFLIIIIFYHQKLQVDTFIFAMQLRVTSDSVHWTVLYHLIEDQEIFLDFTHCLKP